MRFNKQLTLIPDAPVTSIRFGRILKHSEDAGFILAAVLVPDEIDLQGDVISAEEIERAAYDYMEASQRGSYMHKQVLQDVVLVESTILRAETMINGVPLAKGTWLVGFRVYNEELRELIKDGTITGLSIGGWSSRKTDKEPS